MSAASSGQVPAEIEQRISSAVAARNYLAALADLETYQRSNPSEFESNNYGYLRARLAEKVGDQATAMREYQGVVQRHSLLEAHALWHLSNISRSTGNLALERIYLQRLIAFFPKSLVQPAATARLARSYFDSQDYAEAIRLLRRSPSSQRPAATPNARRENLVLLAESYARLGQGSEATALFSKIISENADPAQPDDFALAAVKGLDRLGAVADQPSGATSLTDVEHLQRATIYQFNRDFAGARTHYEAIVTQYPQSGIAPDAMFQIGRGYVQQREFVQAVNWFERVIEQYPEHLLVRDSLLQLASAYFRLSKYREAIGRYKRFIEQFPDDERLDRAYLNIVDVLRDEGEENESLNWAGKTGQVFRTKPPEAIALFAETRIYIARSDWAAAYASLEKLKAFSELGGTRVPGGTSLAEIDFLRGLALEQLRRYPEAIKVYLSIPDGRNEYYGGRATQRLQILASDQSAKSAVEDESRALEAAMRTKDLDSLRKTLQALIRLTDSKDDREKLLERLGAVYRDLSAYRTVPILKFPEPWRRSFGRQLAVPSDPGSYHRQISDALLDLGLYDEGTPELEAAQTGTARETELTLAVYSLRGDNADRAITFAEPLWKQVPSDFQVELMPREQLELLYPAPYKDLLVGEAPGRGVDPRFMLAIMRQESRFRSDIKSYAAARGLMQFISVTSETIAAQLGRDRFEQDELYYPPTAILFGAQYLSGLDRQFPLQPAAVAAAYNGGEDNMQRWLTRSRSNSADQYVAEIMFAQSKDYVYKVMANFRMYKMLYNENLESAQFP